MMSSFIAVAAHMSGQRIQLRVYPVASREDTVVILDLVC